LRVFPMVLPPCALAQVQLEPLGGNRMVDAPNPALDQRPEALDGLGVNIPVHVHLGGMLNAAMTVPLRSQRRVSGSLICEDVRSGKDVGVDMGERGCLALGRYDAGHELDA